MIFLSKTLLVKAVCQNNLLKQFAKAVCQNNLSKQLVKTTVNYELVTASNYELVTASAQDLWFQDFLCPTFTPFNEID